MNAVEERCREAGCSDLDIEIVNLREELPAFYAANGFVPVSTEPFPEQRKLRRDAHNGAHDEAVEYLESYSGTGGRTVTSACCGFAGHVEGVPVDSRGR
jgi:hypothetical protein